MSKHLAVLTVGVLHEPIGHPRVQGFVDRIGGVYDAADASDGFVARSQRNMETMEHSWGPIVYPRCFGEVESFLIAPTTLSIWKEAESLAAFAYHGAHGDAMPMRKEWIRTQDEPTYVLWWIDEGRQVDWTEASSRLDHLHENGPTRTAFDFKMLFDPEGNRTSLKAEAVRAKAGLTNRAKASA